MMIDVDVIAIEEKLGRTCFALVIVGPCFFHLCASAVGTFYGFDTFAHGFSDSLVVLWVYRVSRFSGLSRFPRHPSFPRKSRVSRIPRNHSHTSNLLIVLLRVAF